MELNNEQKFDALKYRHEDQSAVLKSLTDIDLKIIISFFTLQLVLGGFFSRIDTEVATKIGILFIDISISIVCTVLLFYSYKRRLEAVGTIKNCNKALGYEEPGLYLKDGKINFSNRESKHKLKIRPWFWWYFGGILISVIGLVIMLFFTK